LSVSDLFFTVLFEQLRFTETLESFDAIDSWCFVLVTGFHVFFSPCNRTVVFGLISQWFRNSYVL